MGIPSAVKPLRNERADAMGPREPANDTDLERCDLTVEGEPSRRHRFKPDDARQSPSSGRFGTAFTLPSLALVLGPMADTGSTSQSCDTRLLPIPDRPMAFTGSSTDRVDMP